MTSRTAESRSRFFGVVTLRERWGLSARGYAAVAVLMVAVALTVFFGIYPFLAVTERVGTRLLVVEGWIHSYAVRAAAEEFRAGSYERIFSTGGPVAGTGSYTNDFNTSASVGAELLLSEGLPAAVVQMVPSRISARDRTYSSAVALRKWCEENKVALTGVNVVTEDVHARRTRMLFQRALGPEVKVGIIAVPNPDYEPRIWWRYSEGVKTVLSEFLTYLYARFLFFP